MNREFQFRVWDLSKKEFTSDFNGLFIPCFSVKEIPPKTIHLSDRCNVVIQQYTGVKDFYDKPIFEGDIVEIMYSNGHERDSTGDIYGEFKVVFNNGSYQLVDILGYEDDEELWLYAGRKKDVKFQEFKVIGNIFEYE